MSFNFEKTSLEGVLVVTPKVLKDGRGSFMETYKMSDFVLGGIEELFVQDNQSYSCHNVIRGIHFQKKPHSQGKLVRCLYGKIWDVAVDLRPKSPTFSKWVGVELSSMNRKMLYIPEGFGHGFSVLGYDAAEISYKCTHEYNPEADAGIRWDDRELNIDWKVANPILSEKDSKLPSLYKYLRNELEDYL